jgi:hypothetical protein
MENLVCKKARRIALGWAASASRVASFNIPFWIPVRETCLLSFVLADRPACHADVIGGELFSNPKTMPMMQPQIAQLLSRDQCVLERFAGRTHVTLFGRFGGRPFSYRGMVQRGGGVECDGTI